MDHDIEHLQFAEVEHAAQHVGVAAFDRAALGLQLDGATDLVVGGQDVRCVIFRRRTELQKKPDDPLDGHREWRQQPNHAAHEWRDQQRRPVGPCQCIGFWENGCKNDDQQRHDGRRIDDTNIANQLHRQTCRECGRQHVDERVAEQNGTNHFLGAAHQSIDEPRLRVAVLLHRVHAGT